MRLSLAVVMAALALGAAAAAALAADAGGCARIPAASVPPQFQDAKPVVGEGRRYTIYRVEGDEQREAVLRATSNLSFISRLLRVLTHDGKAKSFATLSGLNGLAFGLDAFADLDDLAVFFRAAHRVHTSEFQSAFGPQYAQLLDRAWLRQNMGPGGVAGDDKGLVRLAWVRTGLDRFLCASDASHKVQLALWKRNHLAPLLPFVKQAKLTQEFTVAALAAAAASTNSSFATEALSEALARRQRGDDEEHELSAAEALLTRFLAPLADSNRVLYQNTLLLLGRAVHGRGSTPSPAQTSEGEFLAERVAFLIKYFPPWKRTSFQGVGAFALGEEQR